MADGQQNVMKAGEQVDETGDGSEWWERDRQMGKREHTIHEQARQEKRVCV